MACKRHFLVLFLKFSKVQINLADQDWLRFDPVEPKSAIYCGFGQLNITLYWIRIVFEYKI